MSSSAGLPAPGQTFSLAETIRYRLPFGSWMGLWVGLAAAVGSGCDSTDDGMVPRPTTDATVSDASVGDGRGGGVDVATPDGSAIVDGPGAGGGDGPAADGALGDGPVAVDALPPDVRPTNCGAPGQPCCPTNTCFDGACCGAAVGGEKRCVAPGGECRIEGGGAGGTCTAGACSGCGGALNQACCEGDVCLAQGLVCALNLCKACGTANAPCCAGDICGPGLSCDDGECETCGGPDQPCCAGRTCNDGGCCLGSGLGQCLAQGLSCPPAGPAGGMCAAGKCTGCGAADQPCCLGRMCDGPNLTCEGGGNGSCSPCGLPGQDACPGAGCMPGSCVDDDEQCIAVGATCPQGSGVCTAGGACQNGGDLCGGLDQLCCGRGAPPAGVYCSHPGTVCHGTNDDNERCVLCGGLGQPCCSGSFCRAGECDGPFSNRTCQ